MSSKINIDVIVNFYLPAMSSSGILFKINMSNENYRYHFSSDIGALSGDGFSSDEFKLIYKDNESIYRYPYEKNSLDENGNYFEFGFIEGLIKDNENIVGSILFGLKNTYINSVIYEYNLEIINKIYDENLTLSKIKEINDKDKEEFKNNN